MVSDIFKENWDFGEDIKNDKLENIIFEHIKKIMKFLKKPKINKSSKKEDMEEGIDYHLNWDIPLAFRGRRVNYETYASKQRGGSFTLRATGENGGKAEIYKMRDKEYKSEIYVFVWSCGSYAVINIKKWIISGLIQYALKHKRSIPNKNPRNIFYSFTLSELKRNNCLIYFHNAKNKTMESWF